jgi:two-component system, NarL family, nitrate/nitrite response regulator NarL
MEYSSAVRNVGICETQPLTAEGLRSVLSRTEDLRVCWQADSLMGAIDLVKTQRPDLILADKSFGSQSLLQFLQEVRPHLQNTAVVVWGSSITEPEALRLLQSGVRGVVRKTAHPELVLTCMRSVASGSNWMEDTLFRDPPRMERYPRSELTSREQQVLELVEQGLKNKEIARELGIRPGTVKIHLKHIFEKTGVRGRYGLALTGLKEKGMLEMATVEAEA